MGLKINFHELKYVQRIVFFLGRGGGGSIDKSGKLNSLNPS